MLWDGNRAFGSVPEADSPSPQPLPCPPATGKRCGRQEITPETGGGGVVWGAQMLLEANPGFKELMALVPFDRQAARDLGEQRWNEVSQLGSG